MDSVYFNAMVATANEKYTKLVDSMYKAKTEEDLGKNLNLLRSIYMDQMDLIAMLHDISVKNKTEEKKVELKLFDFMIKRWGNLAFYFFLG